MDLTLGEEHITTFRQALARVTALAHARLPDALHGHLERAHALVRHGHVFPTDDGRHAQVLSSDGERWYPVNGHCTCMDATKAPQGLCKHRLAFALYRRASELLHASPRPLPPGAGSTPAGLPEAPASVNVRLLIAGHECQWTLRDAEETRLAERLEALLVRFPDAVPAKGEAKRQTPAHTQGETPTCPYHGTMKESTKVKGTWFCSSKMGDGSYCKEKFPKK
jgi:hypothetical protein